MGEERLRDKPKERLRRRLLEKSTGVIVNIVWLDQEILSILSSRSDRYTTLHQK